MDITMLTCTYGRPYFLVEAVESFRRQIIPKGVTAEMLIFNDCADQKLVCDVPNVRVVNSGELELLSDVMNAGFQEARGDWVATLDDDDISLPFRLQMSWDFVAIRPSILALRDQYAWIWENGRITGREQNLYIGSAFLNRQYYFDVGAADRQEYWDISIWNKMKADGKIFTRSPTARRTHLIYRWAGMGFHHSGLADGKKSQAELCAAFRAGVRKGRRFVSGEVKVVPEWKQDYSRMVAEAMAEGKGMIK